MSTPRLMIVVFAAIGIVLAAMIVLITRSWLALIAAMAVHGLASAVVITYALKRAAQEGDKPEPVVEARLEEERAQTHAG